MASKINFPDPLTDQQQTILDALARSGGCWNVDISDVDCLSIGAMGRTSIVRFALFVAVEDPALGAAMAEDVDVIVHEVGNPTYLFRNVDKIPFIFSPYEDDDDDEDEWGVPDAF
jgi:hypothetical protein